MLHSDVDSSIAALIRSLILLAQRAVRTRGECFGAQGDTGSGCLGQHAGQFFSIFPCPEVTEHR